MAAQRLSRLKSWANIMYQGYNIALIKIYKDIDTYTKIERLSLMLLKIFGSLAGLFTALTIMLNQIKQLIDLNYDFIWVVYGLMITAVLTALTTVIYKYFQKKHINTMRALYGLPPI